MYLEGMTFFVESSIESKKDDAITADHFADFHHQQFLEVKIRSAVYQFAT